MPVKDTSFTNYINPKITQPLDLGKVCQDLQSTSGSIAISQCATVTKPSSTLCSQPIVANPTTSDAQLVTPRQSRIPIKLSTFNDRLSHLKFLSYVESLIGSKAPEGSSTSAAATERVTFDFPGISDTTCSVGAAEVELPSGALLAMGDCT